MTTVKYDWEEMILLRVMELNSLLPHYWSELFLLAKQLLNDDEERRLFLMIQYVEHMVLEEDYWYNVFVCLKCEFRWGTEEDWFEIESCPECKNSDVRLVQERQSLYDIEMALESNRDFTAYFLRHERQIYKFDVERRLNKIKEWLFQIVKERSQNRRFKRFR